jgi:hypothetical protein
MREHGFRLHPESHRHLGHELVEADGSAVPPGTERAAGKRPIGVGPIANTAGMGPEEPLVDECVAEVPEEESNVGRQRSGVDLDRDAMGRDEHGVEDG